eukprot:TRINITY_DN517_c0_g1_i2.p1 TRINITY_DN517_c0_g1~~TRINITY_DN517_c0_g1_i2.p1  ORF type:complete len:184 (-),score=26.22 TRINITY_DN517_c0_g1_i2:374-859(-)
MCIRDSYEVNTQKNRKKRYKYLCLFTLAKGKVVNQLFDGSVSMRNGVLLLERHLSICLGFPIRLENRIPSKEASFLRSGFNDGAISLSNELKRLWQSFIHIRENGHSISSVIVKGFDHLVKTLRSKLLKEPFNVWSRKSLEGAVAKGGIFGDYGFFNLRVE